MLWYKIKRGKAHALLHVHDSNVVEFWCGKGRCFEEIKPAQFNDEQCRVCLAYIKNEREAKSEST